MVGMEIFRKGYDRGKVGKGEKEKGERMNHNPLIIFEVSSMPRASYSVDSTVSLSLNKCDKRISPDPTIILDHAQ